MKVKTVIEMDYRKVDELVNKHLPTNVPYEFVVDEEANNDRCYSFDGINGKWNDFDKQWTLPDIEKGKRQYMAHHLLNKLCEMGIIPAGDYIIKVSW